MRYTEDEMTHLGSVLMDDMEDTVDFVPNYDDSTVEPSVFPSSFQLTGQWWHRHRCWHGDQHSSTQPGRGHRWNLRTN